MKHRSLLFLPLLACLAAAAPRAVVLIGPHKTGSTYLQSRLIEAAKWLQSAHYVNLGGGSKKGASSFVVNIKHGTPAHESQLAANRKNNINTIISSELFASMTGDSVRRLARTLRDFDVSIVITYRDWLSLMRSFHEQLHKTRFSQTFGEFVFREPRAEFDIRNVIKEFGSVFGRERLYVIDYNGAAAAGRDLFEVLVKEVLRLPMTVSPGPKVNVSPENLLGAQMYRIMTQYAAARYNCSYDAPPYYVKFHNMTVPQLRLDMTKLAEYSRYIDAQFREKYTEGIHLICGNQSATANVVLQAVSEVAANTVMQSATWRAAFDVELRKRDFSKKCK